MPHSKIDEVKPRILFLDAYDSFSHNIVALLITQIECNVDVVKIDDPIYWNDSNKFEQLLQSYDAVVAGPGPGSPTCETDVGLVGRLWQLEQPDLIPVLGICLGFQSLACAFGGRIERLTEPRHGIVQEILHHGTSLFQDIEELSATQYHSLRVRLNHKDEVTNPALADDDLWGASRACPQLLPLAWVCNDVDNGATLMSISHVAKPFWGVQFHPESICTSRECEAIIRNWWSEAQKWNFSHCRTLTSSRILKRTLVLNEFCGQTGSIAQEKHKKRKVLWDVIDHGNLSTADIIELFSDTSSDKPVVLESGTTVTGDLMNIETGRFSIVGLTDSAEHLQYYQSSNILHRFESRGVNSIGHLTHNVTDIWGYLNEYMKQRAMIGGPLATPFWGGLIGFASYEACLGTIDIQSAPSDGDQCQPDLWFLFVQRSLIIDHISKQIYVQSTIQDDVRWISNAIEKFNNYKDEKKTHVHTCEVEGQVSSTADDLLTTSPLLAEIPHHRKPAPTQKHSSPVPKPMVSDPSANHHGPSQYKYTQKVLRCQQHIKAGNSYELCLTDQTHMSLPISPATASWQLYLRLRTLNPAPFSAYFDLQSPCHNVKILSSSPERFLSWNRNGHCQFRPIKGTVQKTPAMTKAKAVEILNSSKERAENLMIVDLIRHDLHGIVGAGNVKVEKLMSVEEYETVYQLVSVIEGQLPTAPDGSAAKTGIDVLAASLPPGSMTGAPKRRSCQLLQEIEDHVPRGVYSGILGYLDVGGGGDFSVVIRTASSWDSDVRGDGRRTWHIGAGGAVTSQSTAQGEWEEMIGKRDALLKVFDGFDG